MSKHSEEIENILSILDQISSSEEVVRQHINTQRYQKSLLKNIGNWNQVCCCLDTIGDTVLSIKDYIKSTYPENIGLKYIFLYGFLQALYVQQDAVSFLSDAFSIKYVRSQELRNIRDIRNASVGHPTKQDINKKKKEKVIYYNFISRISLDKYGFSLMKSSESIKSEFIEINLLSILTEQLSEIKKAYSEVSKKLLIEDKLHRDKYKDQKIMNIFPSSMGYMFEKVAQGIHSESEIDKTISLAALETIQDVYNKLEIELFQRNKLGEFVKPDLDEYKHALERIKIYLSGDRQGMREEDANIYHFYIYQKHDHFLKIAKEVDSEYSE